MSERVFERCMQMSLLTGKHVYPFKEDYFQFSGDGHTYKPLPMQFHFQKVRGLTGYEIAKPELLAYISKMKEDIILIGEETEAGYSDGSGIYFVSIVGVPSDIPLKRMYYEQLGG